MMLADPSWLEYHALHSIGRTAVFYASPHKRTKRSSLDPLFCVQPGRTPRSIMAVGRIQRQVDLDQDDAWRTYGPALGADSEVEWRKQAAAVLRNSRKTYRGRILAIELTDYRAFSPPILSTTLGLTDTGWSDKKDVPDATAIRILQALEPGRPPITTEAEILTTAPQGAGFGTADENRLVEAAAVAAVRAYYEARGWTVRSVEGDRCGFDLDCLNGGETECVEVKGVRGTDQAFIITAGEVQQARTRPGFVLIVVTSALSETPILTRYSATQFLDRFELSVVQYHATLRDRR